VTADIPLAARCLKQGARVLGPAGKPFTDDNIGNALATRDLMSDLRAYGVGGGPPPFGPRDRSRFLEALELVVREAKRQRAASPDSSPISSPTATCCFPRPIFRSSSRPSRCSNTSRSSSATAIATD